MEDPSERTNTVVYVDSEDLAGVTSSPVPALTFEVNPSTSAKPRGARLVGQEAVLHVATPSLFVHGGVPTPKKEVAQKSAPEERVVKTSTATTHTKTSRASNRGASGRHRALSNRALREADNALWYRYLSLLLAFHTEHGHYRVPHTHVCVSPEENGTQYALGEWLQTQRELFPLMEEMDKEKHYVLDELVVHGGLWVDESERETAQRESERERERERERESAVSGSSSSSSSSSCVVGQSSVTHTQAHTQSREQTKLRESERVRVSRKHTHSLTQDNETVAPAKHTHTPSIQPSLTRERGSKSKGRVRVTVTHTETEIERAPVKQRKFVRARSKKARTLSDEESSSESDTWLESEEDEDEEGETLVLSRGSVRVSNIRGDKMVREPSVQVTQPSAVALSDAKNIVSFKHNPYGRDALPTESDRRTSSTTAITTVRTTTSSSFSHALFPLSHTSNAVGKGDLLAFMYGVKEGDICMGIGQVTDCNMRGKDVVYMLVVWRPEDPVKFPNTDFKLVPSETTAISAQHIFARNLRFNPGTLRLDEASRDNLLRVLSNGKYLIEGATQKRKNGR